MSGGTLTVESLLRIVGAIPRAPRFRIIVGMPGPPADAAFRRQTDDESLLLIGHAAYQTLRRSFPPPPHTVIDPRELADVCVMGVPIEFFGDRADHVAILHGIGEALARNALLRVSLDEEFGDTDPRIR